jgi:hypothetical protein
MCRLEAQEGWAQADAFKAAGATRVVCLVKENIGTEVAEFQEKFWGGDVCLDSKKEFYTALGGGKPHKPFSGLAAFLAFLANPFSKNPTKANLKRANGTEQNLTGEGFVAGGWYVIAPDGSAAFSYLEANMGDRPAFADITAAVSTAAGKK